MFHNATPEATKPAPVKTVNELSKSSVELTEAKFKRYNLRHLDQIWEENAENGSFWNENGLPCLPLPLMPRFDHPVSAKETSKNIMTLAFAACGFELSKAQCMIQIWYNSDYILIWYLISRPGALVLLRLGFGDRTRLYVTGDSTCYTCMTCITKRPKPLPKPQHEKSTCLRKEKSQKHSLTLAQVKQWPPFNRDYDWLSVHECVCVLTVHPSSQGKTSSRICPHLTVSSNSLNIGLTSHC